MKKIVNLLIFIIGAVFISSCSSTGTLMSSSSGYGSGYYDHLYPYGYPTYYGANSYYGANPYLYPRTRIIHNNVIVVPDQKKVNERQVHRRDRVSTNSRRSVNGGIPNSSVNRNSNAVRRGSTIAPSSRTNRSGSAPASRAASSRRGAN